MGFARKGLRDGMRSRVGSANSASAAYRICGLLEVARRGQAGWLQRYALLRRVGAARVVEPENLGASGVVQGITPAIPRRRLGPRAGGSVGER